LRSSLRPREVRLVVERRTGINEKLLLKLLADLHLDLEGTILDMPALPLYCPKFSVSIGDKHEPGLQVVDFLLWACARAISKAKDMRWLERLNAAIRIAVSEGGQSVSDGMLHLGWSSVADNVGPHPLQH